MRASTESKSMAPATAEEAVNKGLEFFDAKKYDDALRMFRAAMEKPVSRDEARAAEYNAACALVKLERWGEAADSVKRAIEEHDLKIDVAVQDRDLAPLRERKEWVDMIQALEDGELQTQRMIKMRAEASLLWRYG